MPNQLTSTGIQVAQLAELQTNFTTSMQGIYGASINLNSNSPDGQAMMIFLQSVLDLENLLVAIYNSFDPDQAFGTTLDMRVAINGIQRQAGTFTVTNETIVTSQACTLPGLDQTALPAYTVADNAGNQYQLQATQNPSTAGTYVYAFQAVTPGANVTSPNTIVNPVTIVLGVTSVNNPTTYSTLGINEETDAALKIRRQKSVALASQGYLSGLLASLLNINGVSNAYVYENNGATTDANGVPGHSIWVIMSGSGAAAAIATAIYNKRNAGCGMKGGQTYNIAQADGSTFPVNWDNVTPQNLFIEFTIGSLNQTSIPLYSLIDTTLPTSFVPAVAAEVDISALASAVKAIDPNCFITSAGFCATYNGTYKNFLTPTGKNYQFAVAANQIIILPIIVNGTGVAYVFSSSTGQVTSTTISVAHGGNTFQFSALGGYGTMSWAVTSGTGSINSSTGLYTSSTAGTDVVTVTDGASNTATCTITVT